MPNMRVCKNTGALIFTPTKEELEVRNLKEQFKSEIEEVQKVKEELNEKLRLLDEVLEGKGVASGSKKKKKGVNN